MANLDEHRALIRRALGDRIAEARRAAGLTQGELGERVGLQQGEVSKIEAGTRGCDSSYLPLLADALGVSRSMLVDDLPADRTAA